MGRWLITIPLADLFDDEADIPYEQRRDAIVDRCKGVLGNRHPQFHDLLDEFSFTEDEDEGDDVLQSIYDYCDDNDIWFGASL